MRSIRRSRSVICALALAVAALSACESVEVSPSGAVPVPVAAAIEGYAGIYAGRLAITGGEGAWDEVPFRLKLSVDGARPVVTALDDILGPGCQSSLGQLRSLETGGAWDGIASFDFNPGRCAGRARGRSAVFYVRGGRAMLSLYKDTPERFNFRRPPMDLEYTAHLTREN